MTWVLNGQAQGAIGNPVNVPFTSNQQQITCQLLNPYGCFTEESFTIPPGIFSDFSVAPTADPTSHAFGGQSNLAANLTGIYTEPVSFSWSPTEPLNTSAGSDVVADVVLTTTFVVTVTDAEGCTATGSVVVEVFTVCDTPYISLPNAFTPNSDGTNDTWKLLSEVPIIQMDVAVYNRWGNKVFSSTEPQFIWPGKLNDVDLPSDSYTYTLRAVCVNGEIWQRQGDLLLMR
jgi:gliding motility-associated-like protein